MKKIIPLALLCFGLSAALVAQAVVPEDIYRQADSAILEKSMPKLDAVLAKNSSAPWYPRLESYILKRARQMVIQNDLEQAKALSLALIDRNLDNREAVDLYQSVQGAVEKRDAELKKTAEKEQIANFKQQAAEAKIKQDLSKTYKTATNTATGKKVYLDQSFNDHYRSNAWDAMLGLANLGLVSDNVETGVKYGLSLSAAYFYHAEDFSIGADIEGGAMVLTFTGEPAVDWSGSLVASAASNAVGKYLVLRLGYAAFMYDSGSETKAERRFNTPVAGLGFRDIRLGETGRFKISADYYPGYLAGSGIDFAMGASTGIALVLAEMQDFDIHFHADLKDTVVLYPEGLKNDVKLILAIGAGNYD